MASSNINEKVQQALEEGHPWEDIKAHLNTLDNPEAKSYLAGLKTSSQQSQEPQRDTLTRGLDYVQENPKEALGYGAALYGATQLPKVISGIADYRLEKRKVDLKERSLAAYEAQVSKQGLTAADSLVPHDELINSVRQNEFEQQKATQPTQPTARELKDQIALQREQLKLEQDKIKHENFVRQNQWSPEEIALGRKIKTPAEMQIAKTVMAQQAAKSGVAPTTASPITELSVTTPAAAPIAPTPIAPAPIAPTAAAPIVAPAQADPVITQPANVVSTGPTPEAAAAPIEKAEEIKAVSTPKKVKTPLSPEDAKLTKQELGMKKHLVGMYGGSENPLAAEKAYGTVKEILGYTPAYPVGEGGSLSKEETGKVLSYRKENIPGPKVNLTKEMKTILRKGGPAVALLAATTEFANAKTAEEKANAGTNLIGAILPPGADIFEAGAPTVGQQSIENAYKLGSPYAQTKEAKLARLREKAGAGRGIAPPSAYMR